jgi:ABC-type Fe3+ transport system substrate-binding protein
MGNAKLFMDWIASDTAQALWGTSTARQANTNVPTTNKVLTPSSEITLSARDNDYLAKNQAKIIEKWTQTWAKHN